jgi:hypothetical protein
VTEKPDDMIQMTQMMTINPATSHIVKQGVKYD